MLPVVLSLCKMAVEMFPEGPCEARKYFQSAEKKHLYFACTEQWQPLVWCCGLSIFHNAHGTAEVSLISEHLLLIRIGA